MKKWRVWAAAALISCTSGCQTYFNVAGRDSEVAVYGGVRRNVEALKWAAQDPDGTTRVFLPVVVLDLPLTVVADTLTLPYTVAKDETTFKRPGGAAPPDQKVVPSTPLPAVK